MAIHISDLFLKSKSTEAVYKGKKIYKFDYFDISQGDSFIFNIESTNSEWKQAIGFLVLEKSASVSCSGHKNNKGFNFWEHNAPRNFTVNIVKTKKRIRPKAAIYNMWEGPSGEYNYPDLSAAMKIEKLKDGSKRYYCNDGQDNDDFDDIIFTVKHIK